MASNDEFVIRWFLAVVLCASLGGGCFSSSHIPRNDGRVATVMDGGSRAYHRDGRVYRAGFFRGGLEQALRGVPEAEAAARTYRRRVVSGTIATGLSIACLMVATPLIFYHLNRPMDQRQVTAAKAALWCFAGEITGSLVVQSGMAYHDEAINIFNDSLPPDGPIYLPGQPQRKKQPIDGAMEASQGATNGYP